MRVPLEASLLLREDLTPERFEIKGKTSRFTEIDASVLVEGRTATVSVGGRASQVGVPDRWFTTGGYAPVAIQMMLLRFWDRHGRPAAIDTLPAGKVTIEHRGRDTVEIGGKPVELDRYSVGGLIWGRETLWLEPGKNLVAAVTVDAEYNRFEAVRDGYEEALATFVRRAGEDGMAVLAVIADRLDPRRRGMLAIVGGTLIDGTGTDPVEDAVIVVAGDRITAAGPRSQVAVPDGAAVLDATGKSVLSGLWEMHAHVTQVEWGPIYLAAGVTTARDCANEFEFIVAVRDAIAAGRGLGPRLLLAGIVDGDGPKTVGTDIAANAEQARAKVRRYKDAGFVQMKVYSSLKPELVPIIAEEAHRLGMGFTGHVPEGMSLVQAVEAGMDQINHVYHVTQAMLPGEPPRPPDNPSVIDVGRPYIDVDVGSDRAKQVVRLLKVRGTVIDPTLVLMEMILRPLDRPLVAIEPGVAKVAPELAGPLNSLGVPAEQREVADAIFRKHREVVAALHRAGVSIVAGTDQSVPGRSLYRELELYVQAGMTPMEAIRSATIVPARAMKLDDKVGTVEPGKRADLILVAGRPDKSISEIRKVKTVVAGGRVFDCAELWKCVGFRP
jgi:Amidohydrolase family